MDWERASKIEGGVDIPESWVRLPYYEAFNLLFRIENALRVFVYIVLKSELNEEWQNAQLDQSDETGTISSVARKRSSQAQAFGYLGYTIANPLMHLNGGELSRLIASDTYWRHFKPHFRGSREIIRNKLDEVGSIRNSLAHFRPIREDDVEVIRQNSKHFMLGVEDLLNQVLLQRTVVPTNTEDDWYSNLGTLGTDHCVLKFSQSADERWVRLNLRYCCPVLSKRRLYGERFDYRVLTLQSSAVLEEQPEIARDICYLSEHVGYPQMDDGYVGRFSKTLSFVLNRAVLQARHAELKASFEELLRTITEETQLIEQDNLARGKIVQATSASASPKDEGSFGPDWVFRYRALATPVADGDPPEYWGDFNFSGWADFVSSTNEYPWMPASVSDSIPF